MKTRCLIGEIKIPSIAFSEDEHWVDYRGSCNALYGGADSPPEIVPGESEIMLIITTTSNDHYMTLKQYIVRITELRQYAIQGDRLTLNFCYDIVERVGYPDDIPKVPVCIVAMQELDDVLVIHISGSVEAMKNYLDEHKHRFSHGDILYYFQKSVWVNVVTKSGAEPRHLGMIIAGSRDEICSNSRVDLAINDLVTIERTTSDRLCYYREDIINGEG